MYEDVVKSRFGRLFVDSVERIDNASGKNKYYYVANCSCDCGEKIVVRINNLLRIKGGTKSCGCLRKNNQANIGRNNPRFNGHEDIGGHFWSAYVIRANKKGLDFNITKEYIWNMYLSQDKKCALSGVPIKFQVGRSNVHSSASIDRIDSSIGYVPGNVQLVHKTINLMKNTMSDATFVEWCKLVSHNDCLM